MCATVVGPGVSVWRSKTENYPGVSVWRSNTKKNYSGVSVWRSETENYPGVSVWRSKTENYLGDTLIGLYNIII